MVLQSFHRFSSRLASLCRPGVAVDAARRRSRDGPPNHHLILYDFEASPWCRLVREYATILDLKLHIRPCPRQTLVMEGAFDATSRFRPEAMDYLRKYHGTDDLTFPLLVDCTDSGSDPTVIVQSYDILDHLWKCYGQDVVPTKDNSKPRPDQRWNATSIPFPLRFLVLGAPSFLRPWPTCGIMKTPSIWNHDDNDKELTLYQAEGCPESRLVRETLCTLEIPYLSSPTGNGSSHLLPDGTSETPVLIDGDTALQGANACQEYLWATYRDPNGRLPQWWNFPPKDNIGRDGSVGVGVYAAFLRGSRAFVPDRAFG